MAENLKPGFLQSGFWASRTAVVLGSPGNGQRGGSQRCPRDSPVCLSCQPRSFTKGLRVAAEG